MKIPTSIVLREVKNGGARRRESKIAKGKAPGAYNTDMYTEGEEPGG